MSHPTTTLSKIREHNTNKGEYLNARKRFGGLKKYGKDTPITIRQLIDRIGLDLTLRCLKIIPENDNLWRLLAVRYARHVQHLMNDAQSIEAIDIAERYALGHIDREELLSFNEATRLTNKFLGHADRAAAWTTYDNAGSAALLTATYASWACDEKTYEEERRWQADELIRLCEKES